jgi:hypothetical protein
MLVLPQELQKFTFDYRYMMRGLIIDKKRGNVLKMDRHKYVKLAFHGFQPLQRDDRLATYANTGVSTRSGQRLRQLHQIQMMCNRCVKLCKC